jgi:hypothetical protein
MGQIAEISDLRFQISKLKRTEGANDEEKGRGYLERLKAQGTG